MQISKIVMAKFIERPNRFIAIVEIDGRKETVHVKNTGRCQELLLPNSQVVLADNIDFMQKRKTRYDLIGVWKKDLGWVNIDSQAPNKVVGEWLAGNKSIFKNLTYIKPEYSFGKSRIDFYLETKKEKILLEVKGCTLEIDGTGYFPDAPTLRGIKHLQELAQAIKKGYKSYLAFVITMPKVTKVLPNKITHPEFAEELAKAQKAGVKILFLPCLVKPGELKIKRADK